jgi:glycosyltransferase involved in cell wall biosynthesis
MISVTILAKNNEKYLNEVLESLSSFDEVLVYDNGSTDATMEIARNFNNVRLVEGPFMGFGSTHNKASSLAKHDWILSIDSDEVVSKDLATEINALALDEACVYSFPRHNYYIGKFIKWCGWYPDRQYRLYNRTKTQFTNADVHEQVIVEGMKHLPLKNPIKHYSYSSVEEFLTKMQCYSNLFARQNCGKKRSSPIKAFLHGIFAFAKSYFIKRGFLGGYEGFLISAYNGHTAFYKYMKLYEANKNMALPK